MAKQRRQRIVLDTNIVIDFLKGREPLASKFPVLQKKYRLAITTAIALSKSLPLMTKNTKHFERISKLALIKP